MKDITRIFQKIEVDPDTDCWIWTGAKIGNRYGAFRYKNQTITMHRFLYAWLIEPLPLGSGNGVPVLDHTTCDNPACCNPNHLTLGTQKRNVLRGGSPSADNARKTHCKRGHLLPATPNELWGKNRKGRRCIPCRRINAKRRYHARQAMK